MTREEYQVMVAELVAVLLTGCGAPGSARKKPASPEDSKASIEQAVITAQYILTASGIDEPRLPLVDARRAFACIDALEGVKDPKAAIPAARDAIDRALTLSGYFDTGASSDWVAENEAQIREAQKLLKKVS